MKDNEKKAFELNDEDMKQVIGGFGIQGEHVCPCGFLYASASTCNKNCSEYDTSGAAGASPFCDFYHVIVD